ncbi:hypothetical protein C815_01249 [Firmicutes bacterium M10-2]|nr:hypothetical protein C815_01249 [Firmicutes bacterium M10-2]
MVKVSISKHHKDIQNIDIKGHAFGGDPGQDLVCAGISTTVFGMLNALDELFPEHCDLTLKDNQIGIYVNHSNDSIQLMLKTLLIQLKTVQEYYPDKIKFTRKEV